MRFLISVFFLSSLVFSFEYDMQPTKVDENVWCFLGKLEAPSKENGGAMSNSCYVKTDKGYVVIDSGPSFKFAQYSYNIMKSKADLPVLKVINTHYHDDHWLGNSFYKDKFGAELIGVELQDKNYKPGDKTRMFQLMPEIMEGTRIVKLDRHVNNDETLSVGDTKFELIPIEYKAHTPEDIFVFLPKKKVVFSGDLVMNGRITSNRDGSVLGEIKALKKINSLSWSKLVPGHGHDTGKTATDESVEYFTTLKTEILKAIEDGVEAVDINKHVTMEKFKDKAMFNELNSRNVFDGFAELEFYDGE